MTRTFLSKAVLMAATLAMSVAPLHSQEVSEDFYRLKLSSPIIFAGGDTPGEQPSAVTISADLVSRSWRENEGVSFPVTISGGVLPYADISASNGFQHFDGSIVGTPSSPGVAPYLVPVSVTVADQTDTPTTQAFDVTVYPQITVTMPGNRSGMVGASVSAQVAANGIVATPSFEIVQNTLDAIGLSFNQNTGAISGTVTTPGTGALQVRAIDSIDGKSSAASSTFSYVASAALISKSATAGTNRSADSYFTNAEWTSTTPKILTVPNGVTLSSTIVSTAALTVPDTLGGTLQIVVNSGGSIRGKGGSGGSVENNGTGIGGNGGTALLIQAGNGKVSLVNNGNITGGGGGGGAGGAGGDGRYALEMSHPNIPAQTADNFCFFTTSGSTVTTRLFYNGTLQHTFSGTQLASTRAVNVGNYSYKCGGPDSYVSGRSGISRLNATLNPSSGTSGAAGGAGQGPTVAGNGPDAVTATNNAGTGGKGGKGGDYGQSGNAGLVGEDGLNPNGTIYRSGTNGFAGGLAGYSIENVARLISRTGTGVTAGRL